MQKIYLVYSIWDAAYWSTAYFLQSARQEFSKINLTYNPYFLPISQVWGHDAITQQLKCYWFGMRSRAGADYLHAVDAIVTSHLQQLDADAASGRNILAFCGSPHPDSLPLFFSRLAMFPHLKACELHVVMLLGRQDSELRTLFLRNWKKRSPDKIYMLQLREDGRHRMDEVYSMLMHHCGKENCHLLLHQSTDPHMVEPQLLMQLSSALGIPEDVAPIPSNEFSFPLSAPGLDMSRALFGFPFSFKQKPVWKRDDFYRILRSVEQKEGYAPVPFMPREHALDLLSKCVPGNTRLAETLGKETLFASPHPLDTLPDMPSTLPEMSTQQCRTFVSAFSSEWRQAFLRYFRDQNRPLHSVEHRLASVLEEYRQRNHSQSPYTWPRTTSPVAVLTLCRNQEAFIEQCMESVTDQRCKIPFEHIIVDDSSNDDSASIIDNYASRHAHVRPMYLSCHAAHGENVQTLFSLCHSTYVALCDGDDYFTDPYKLQKQVDFLDMHPQCSLCFHPVDAIYEDGSPSRVYPPENLLPGGVRTFYTVKDLLFANLIQTNSVMYRWRFRDGLPDWFDPSLIPGDWYWHLLHAEVGLIGYLQEHMSVYRRHAASLYASAEGDHVDHRNLHGLEELRMYNTCNKHFSNRYYKDFCRLAMGVLTDFVHIYAKSGDDTLLQKGCKLCPEFARDFLSQIRIDS